MLLFTAAVALLLCFVPGGQCDTIKWAQDRKHLFVTVSFDCSKNKKFTPSELKFDLECTSAKGKKQTMSFGLREHIVPAASSCKTTKDGEELCTLEKKFPHFFDRLVENPDELKHLKQDWFRWNDEDENHIPEDPYDGVNASLVLNLNTANITQAMKEGKVVFADVSFPWCSTCSFAKRPFIAAAKKLSSETVLFGRVDAREDKAAAAAHNVSCDQRCDFLVFRQDEEPERVEGEANEKDFLKKLKAYQTAPVTHVGSDQEVDAVAAKHKVTALVLLKGGMMSKATASKEYKTVREAARLTRGKVRWLFADKSLKSFGVPSLNLLVKGQEAVVMSHELKDSNASALAQSAVVMSLPLMDDYAWEKRKLHEEFPLPIGMAWAKSEKEEAVFKALAKELRGKVMMLKMGSNDNFMLKDFGVEDKDVGDFTFGIAKGFEPTADRFLYEGTELDQASVSKFVTDALAGNVPLAHKTEKIPAEEWTAGTVRHLVSKNARDLTSKGGIMVVLYKAWGTGVGGMLAGLEKVAHALGDIPDVAVAKYDMSKNFVDPAVFPGIDEYEMDPAAFFCLGEGKPCERFKGPITQKDLLKALAKTFPKVKASWEDKVKPRLKAAADAAKAEKERVLREAEEKKAQLEAEVKEMEEKLATVEKLEIGTEKKDNVIKQILKEGDGDYPGVGEDVKVHYTGTLLDGTKFDSSRDRDTPFGFNLGSFQVIKCWEEGVATMKKGERAVFTCQPEVAYGARGAPPKIPPNAVLRFDVELLDFGPAGGGGGKTEL